MKLGEFTDLYTSILTSGDTNLLKTPFLLIGSVGIGKTTSIRYAAKKAGYEVVSFVLSRHRPEHLEGVLIPPKSGNIADKLIPPIFEALQRNDGKVVVFFDEINTAPPSLINAALSFIQDRELAGIKIPDSVAMIAAGNPVGSAEAYVDSIKPVLTSRMVVLNVEADLDYLYREGIAHKIYSPEVISYLSIYPEAYDDHTPYPIGDGTANAYAVPRTWAYLSKYLQNKVISLTNEDVEVITGFVGEEHALRLLDFSVTEDIIKEVLNTRKYPNDVSDIVKMSIFVRVIMILLQDISKKSIEEQIEILALVSDLVTGLKEELQYSALKLFYSLGSKVAIKVYTSLISLDKSTVSPDIAQKARAVLDRSLEVLVATSNVQLFEDEE